MLESVSKKSRHAADIMSNILKPKSDVYYIVENANWSIRHDGLAIRDNISDIKVRLSVSHAGIRDSIIHFGSINTLLRGNRPVSIHKSNKSIVTWFHVVPCDHRDELAPELVELIDMWHTSCSITRNKLLALGVPSEKIVVIPLGVNTSVFKPVSGTEKILLKRKFNIPENTIVIGSFQKDGQGFGDGLQPKMVKGPDVFCEVVERLSKFFDIFVLLTGPARGYVKNRLNEIGVAYLHHVLDIPEKVAEYFKMIDLYIVTSRQEGGPKAILEAMASEIPLVSTEVGMVPDIIQNNRNGFICKQEDVNGIVSKSIEVIRNPEQTNEVTRRGLVTAKQYDWSDVAQRYYHELYSPLL